LDPIVRGWQANPQHTALVATWQKVPALVAKALRALHPMTSAHNFMHLKVLVSDDTLPPDSYNFSANADNAENQIHLTTTPSHHDALPRQVIDATGGRVRVVRAVAVGSGRSRGHLVSSSAKRAAAALPKVGLPGLIRSRCAASFSAVLNICAETDSSLARVRCRGPLEADPQAVVHRRALVTASSSSLRSALAEKL